jgi:hypothetical protein
LLLVAGLVAVVIYSNGGGGGGAGGYLTGTTLSVNYHGSYTVTVGAGARVLVRKCNTMAQILCSNSVTSNGGVQAAWTAGLAVMAGSSGAGGGTSGTTGTSAGGAATSRKCW